MKLTLAIALIVIGIVSLAYQGFSYKTRDKTVDFGPLQVTTEQIHTIPLPPILGVLTLAGGIVLLVMNDRKS